MNYFSKTNIIQTASFCCKFILANVIAILFTSCIICFYYNKSSSQLTLNGSPFPHLKSYSRCFLADEGHCYGKFDFNGFNNLYCVENNIQVLPPEQTDKQTSQVHSLLLGSSEMYASHVPMDKNCCYLINKRNERDKRSLLYNIGISGHALVYIVNTYKEALDYFQPMRYTIIETRRLPQSDELKNFETAEKVRLNHLDNKLAIFISEHIYSLRWMMLNIQQGLEFRQSRKVVCSGTPEVTKNRNEENVVYLRKFLQQIAEPSRVRNVCPILFYHPHFTLHTDGSVTFDADPRDVELYRTECEKQGIVFVYLGDRFLREYEENNILPYGFWNTTPNTGHLNVDGHRMIADELYEVIEQLEKERNENVQ